ncbi:hypothetical protein QUF81_11805 [Peribacillus simplex]|nr:hypothetical protein [Peribacillus simplex]MDM5293862.1 hypothetical protein [Peribacillus simplex]
MYDTWIYRNFIKTWFFVIVVIGVEIVLSVLFIHFVTRKKI